MRWLEADGALLFRSGGAVCPPYRIAVWDVRSRVPPGARTGVRRPASGCGSVSTLCRIGADTSGDMAPRWRIRVGADGGSRVDLDSDSSSDHRARRILGAR